MSWFRQHRRPLMQLTLWVWLLAVLVMAFQGCLTQAAHSPTAPHTPLATMQQEPGHALHVSGGLQHCEEAAQALSPLAQILAVEFVSLAILLLPLLLLFNPAQSITCAALALRCPAPTGSPARLMFARFND